MAAPEQVSVVIPAFNEQAGIGAVVENVLKQAAWREVLVIDDGSSDETAVVASAAGARVIRHPYNKGNGAAIKTGVRAAQGEILLFMDADGQHDAQDALRLIDPIGVYDMVIGARSMRDQALTRALGNWVFQSLASFLTGRQIPDLTSGFRAVRRAPFLDILHLLPNSFSYPTTSCLAFLKAGLSVSFLNVACHTRVGRSKIRPLRDGMKFLLIILKIVTLYSPLRVFLPLSFASLLMGTGYGLWNVYFHQKIPAGAALLIQLAVIVFLFGLISEQIAAAQERK
ncbi:MAG: glycosyltransferase family 2 protein [Vicinamibacteria bacterium]|jgi:glycosyltransferase involved in cell wall biosynthesis|nr:glycosyltransferase family 2 protein [Vicinamibacteria bacterium]